jgi:hypothetical protein
MQGLQHNLTAANKGLEHSRADYIDLMKQLLLAQQGTLRNMQKGGWIPKEDNRIRDDFINLEERLKSWAKTHAVVSPSAIENLSVDDKQSIITFLDGYCIQLPWETIAGHLTEKIQRKLPILFVHATMAKFAFGTLFSYPFLFLRNSYAGTLQELYEIFQKGNVTNNNQTTQQWLNSATSGYGTGPGVALPDHAAFQREIRHSQLGVPYIRGDPRPEMFASPATRQQLSGRTGATSSP